MAGGITERVPRIWVDTECQQLVETGDFVAQDGIVKSSSPQGSSGLVDVAFHVIKVLKHTYSQTCILTPPDCANKAIIV